MSKIIDSPSWFTITNGGQKEDTKIIDGYENGKKMKRHLLFYKLAKPAFLYSRKKTADFPWLGWDGMGRCFSLNLIVNKTQCSLLMNYFEMSVCLFIETWIVCRWLHVKLQREPVLTMPRRRPSHNIQLGVG